MTTVEQGWLAFAGLLGATGVALGAFGAHALEGSFDARQSALWQTATFYLLVHAVGLLGATALGRPTHDGCAPLWRVVSLTGLGVGAVMFAGSLYALALGAPRMVGAVTPIGGLLLITGWLALVATALMAR